MSFFFLFIFYLRTQYLLFKLNYRGLRSHQPKTEISLVQAFAGNIKKKITIELKYYCNDQFWLGPKIELDFNPISPNNKFVERGRKNQPNWRKEITIIGDLEELKWI